MALMRRKRLADGSFGELEKVFDGETSEEKIERLEKEKEDLKSQLLEVQEYILETELEKLLEKGGMTSDL